MKKILSLLCFFMVFLPIFALASPSQVDFLLSGMTDSSGNLLNGGKVYTYTAGTTSNKTTWQDFAEATPQANPIILDSQGRKQVFADGLYKFVVKDSSDNTLYTWDNLYFANYNGVLTYAGATTGSSNAYVATLSPALLSLVDGAEITFVPNFTNTAAATLNVNGLGAKSILHHDTSATVAKDLVNGGYYTARYSTTNTAWILQVPALGYSTWTSGLTPQAGSASAITYNTNNYVQIGKMVCLQLDITWTQASSSANYVTISLPVTSAASIGPFAAYAAYDGTLRGGYAIAVTTSTVRIYDVGNNAFTAGSSREAALSGCYFAS